MRMVLTGLVLALALPAALPVAAQSMLKPAPADTSLPREKHFTVFGNDPCPKASSPDEIVVCSRRPDEERYRIPPAVRTASKTPSPFAQNRKLLLGDTTGGAGGSIGSCSSVGPGGSTGCQYKLNEAWGGVPR